MEVIQDSTHNHLYRIKMDDGTISDGLWNRSRAVEQIKVWEEEMAENEALAAAAVEIPPSTAFKMPRKRPEKATGELFSKKGMEVAG